MSKFSCYAYVFCFLYLLINLTVSVSEGFSPTALVLW